MHFAVSHCLFYFYLHKLLRVTFCTQRLNLEHSLFVLIKVPQIQLTEIEHANPVFE